MIVLIPSFEPDDALIEIVSALLHGPTVAGFDEVQAVVVVDDGSGPEYVTQFDAVAALGAEVLHLVHNAGKGSALKTGFAHIKRRYPGHAVVTADADGQHRPHDIRRVAIAVKPNAIVMGVREFSTGAEVAAEPPPLKSRLGNQISRGVFRILSGVELDDTQTGLRGYPVDLLDWLAEIPGERFEYEFEMLFAAARRGIELTQVRIETVYLRNNESSHFRPLADSWRVYRPVVAFVASSLSAFVIDAVAFFTLFGLTRQLLFSVAGARVLSATVNYNVNRARVFPNPDGTRPGSLRRYVALAAMLGTANYGILWLLVSVFAVPVVAAKVLTETILYVASFIAQQRIVFAARRASVDDPAPDRTANPIEPDAPNAPASTQREVAA